MKNLKIPLFLLCVVYPLVYLIGMGFLFSTCNSRYKRLPLIEAEPVVKKKEFVMVSIPEILRQPKDRAAYLVTHYWDNFDFSDTAYMHLPEITEQAFANYIEVLAHTDRQTIDASIESLLTQAKDQGSAAMYGYFCELFKKYLYEPHSALRNDELYIPVVRYIINDPASNDADRSRAEFALSMMLKNRIGQMATDFTYRLATANTGTLYQIKSDYTLLFFYNPDCHDCVETIAGIKASPVLNASIVNRTLSVLAFYPDADISIWKKYLGDIPSTWINGYDRDQVIHNKRLYELKAIPSLYLLDRDKRVILKDTELILIEEYLMKASCHVEEK